MKNDYLNSKGINLILDKKIKEMSFSGAAIDSKQIKKDNLFFALKGKNTDGHRYLNEAFKNGASLAIVEKIQRKIKHPQLKVHNVHRAMIKLAKFYRN
jgi:murE/murF fusion protein